MTSPAYPDDPGGIRSSLNWLHTWLGLGAGVILFVIFWMGTLSVFDWEIDRWTMPATRHAAPAEFSIDSFHPLAKMRAPGAEVWSVTLPTDRAPAKFSAHFKDESNIDHWIDPRSGALLPDQGTHGGTGFFYPYHFTLNIAAFNIGLFLCAFAGVGMMVLCLSGVIIHRRIFADFFTFRASRRVGRSTLDLHNLSGVLALPFHFIIALSGVALFTVYYLPTTQSIVFAHDPAALDEDYFSRDATGRPGAPLVSLDAVAHAATRYWQGVRPGTIAVYHPGDANAYIEARWPLGATLAARYHSIWFDGATGRMLTGSDVSRASESYAVLWGLHVVQFRHLTIRWLYFASGLAGCILIATGLIFWSQSRRKRHIKAGQRGARLVEAITIGATTGLILATISFFIANRILPTEIAQRATAEAWLFHLVWIAAFAHAGVRGGSAWREQAWLIAAAGSSAVVLNAATTGDAIWIAIARGQWGVGGIDIALLLGAAVAGWAGYRLKHVPSRIRRATLGTAEASP